MYNRLKRTQNELIKNILNTETKGGWLESTQKVMQEIGITDDEMNEKKYKTKRAVKLKTAASFKQKIEKSGENKSKITFLTQEKPNWQVYKRETYMNKLDRNDTSTIFKARTRMVSVKNNFRGMHKDNMCRACGQHEETQEHILEICEKIHSNNTTKVATQDIFTNDTDKLKQTAVKIRQTLQKLEEYCGASSQPGSRAVR